MPFRAGNLENSGSESRYSGLGIQKIRGLKKLFSGWDFQKFGVGKCPFRAGIFKNSGSENAFFGLVFSKIRGRKCSFSEWEFEKFGIGKYISGLGNAEIRG